MSTGMTHLPLPPFHFTANQLEAYCEALRDVLAHFAVGADTILEERTCLSKK